MPARYDGTNLKKTPCPSETVCHTFTFLPIQIRRKHIHCQSALRNEKDERSIRKSHVIFVIQVWSIREMIFSLKRLLNIRQEGDGEKICRYSVTWKYDLDDYNVWLQRAKGESSRARLRRVAYVYYSVTVTICCTTLVLHASIYEWHIVSVTVDQALINR